MTWRSRVFSLFPAAFLLMAVGLLVFFVAAPGLVSGVALLFHLYLLPMVLHAVHCVVWPLREGVYRLDAPGIYVPWWGSHMLQLPYDSFPQLEATLRLVPGLYSLWLRGWGARIGRSVYWTPLVEISDRRMLVVGDGAVIGHKVVLCAHLVQRKEGGVLRLYVRSINIGSAALIGAGSRLGPGAEVQAGEQLPALSDRWAGGAAPEAK